jgi:archaetidylinositol phosphate synthase
MTLDRLRPLLDGVLDPFVSASDRLGLTPDAVSLLALAVAVGAAGAFAVAGTDPWLYAVGAVLVGVNGWLDVLDGALAREQGVDSTAGDLLDHVLDRYADVVVVAGLAAGVDRFALGFAAVTGVLLTSYLGTQTQAVGLERTYGGLVGRADRLALVGVVGLLAAVWTAPVAGLRPVAWLLVALAVAGHLTALQRFAGAYGDLR